MGEGGTLPNVTLGRDCFCMLDNVTRRSENWDLKKRKRILPDTTAKLFVLGFIRNYQENILELNSALINYVKIAINRVHVLFCVIADLKNFRWCNVIQQIKRPSPKTSLFLFVGLCYPLIWKIGISKLFVFGIIENHWENS